MRLPGLVFTGLLIAVPCRAETIVGSDFAFGIELSPQQKQAVHSFALPEQVLRTLTDRELGDLCVFDADGARRPHAVHIPRDTLTSLVDEPVVHFPLEAQSERATDGVEVRVERDPTGNITRAFSKSIVEHDARVAGYLIDAHSLTDPIVGLTLSIHSTHDYTLQLQVDVGEDLESFRPDNTATVAHLENDGRTLDRDYVELSGELHAKFLRVSFPRSGAGDDLRIEKVQARVLRPTKASERHYVELSRRTLAPGEQVTRQDPSRAGQSFEYTIDGVFTFDRYRVELPGATPLIEASLLSAPAAKGPFRELDRGLFRQADAQTRERELAPTEHNFFELRVSDKGGGVREGEPKLRMGYLAPQLLFAGNDSSTYLLAYGSASGRCRRFAENELTEDGATPEVALSDSVRALRTKTLGGRAVLDKPEPPRPWRVYVLWGVLLVAVGALAFAARKLVKDV